MSETQNSYSPLVDDALSDRVPTGFPGWFIAGLLTPLDGFRLVSKIRNLTMLVVTPVLIQTAITGLLLFGVYLAADFLLDWIHQLITWLADKFNQSHIAPAELSAETLNTGATIAVWSFILLVALWGFLVFWRLTGGILCGYYGGKICEAAIAQQGWSLGGTMPTTILGEMVSGALFVFMMTWIQPALGLLPFIPIIGPLIAIILGSLYAAFLTGYGELRDPLEQMGIGKLKALMLSIKYYSATFGIGFATVVSQPLPLLGGLVQASESLGRIALARKILIAEGIVGANPSPEDKPGPPSKGA